MSIFKLLTSVFLAVFTVTALRGERRCPGNVPSVPLRQVQRAVNVVGVSVNGAGPFDFLVDTGAQTSTVDEQLASQLRLPVRGMTGVFGAATYGRRAYAQLTRVEVGDRQVSDVLAVIDSLRELHAADGRIRGILGENFLTQFDFLIDNQHHALCLDNTRTMAAAMKGTRVALARPHGEDHDLPFTRPLVIEAHLEGISNSILFRLDSGSNVPLIYNVRDQSLDTVQTGAQILKREFDGVEQHFAVLQPRNVSFGDNKVRVIFVEPLNSIGAVRQSREDGLLPTQLFQRVFVSYSDQSAILDLK